MSDSFGARLRYERERRQIALQTIAENTKISVALLEGLERDNVSRWPTGIFRKAFIRSYAAAIGLDPEAIGREFADLYPDPTEVAPVAAQVPIPLTPPGKFEPVVEAVRTALARAADRISRINVLPQSMSQLPAVTIKFTIVSTGSTFTKGTFLNDVRKRWLAAACDAGVSCVVALCLFAVVGRFWTPLGVSMLCYYVGGIVILGNTPGVCLFAPERTDSPPANRRIEPELLRATGD